MEKYVPQLQQSKKIYELGIDIKSLFNWVGGRNEDFQLYQYDKLPTNNFIYPAPVFDDIYNYLIQNEVIDINIKIYKDSSVEFILTNKNVEVIFSKHDNIIDNAAEGLIYLKENII